MIIYKVTNTLNGKIYIGKTTRDLKKRKWAHYDSAKNLKSQTNFHRALVKYPKKIFKWEIIAETFDLGELDELEKHYINEYDTFKHGYNMTLGGDGGFTYSKGSELYERIKHKLGKWKEGNPGATKSAIEKRIQSFKNTKWVSGVNHSNTGHSHNKGMLLGEKNPMYGNVPTNARKVIIDGVIYDSLKAASLAICSSPPTIRKKCLDSNISNFNYLT
jgi:group I intron endonuclease